MKSSAPAMDALVSALLTSRHELGQPQGASHDHPQVLDGRDADLADGVRRALDHEPGDFGHFAGPAAALRVWTAR